MQDGQRQTDPGTQGAFAAVNGPTHRQLGFLAGAAVALGDHQPVVGVALSGVYASASAHGWLSPDVDQTEAWMRVRQVARPLLPRSKQRLLNHRYLSHWWGLPVVGGYAVSLLPPEFAWSALMLVVGWASHLVGDFVFGEGPHGGIPLLPWGRHVGLHMDTGGFWETGVARSRKWRIPFAPTQVLIGLGICFCLLYGVMT